MEFKDRIIRDPEICGGEAVIACTRVTIRTILASLAERDRIEDILADFPALSEDDVWAVIAFAAPSAEDDLPIHAVPSV